MNSHQIESASVPGRGRKGDKSLSELSRDIYRRGTVEMRKVLGHHEGL